MKIKSRAKKVSPGQPQRAAIIRVVDCSSLAELLVIKHVGPKYFPPRTASRAQSPKPRI